jgi:glycosyltransferase involved in cell wall biosynthesis
VKVSVVTPSFNQGRFIERTLASVAKQEGAVIEHLVFDGGSSDDTVAILKRFEPRIRWVSRSDRGQSHAVNQGFCAAGGEILGWLNSDDIYYPGAVARVLAFFDANPQVDVVYGQADHIDVNDRAFQPYPTEPWDFSRLMNACFICQPAVFLRRRVIEQHGLLDESLQFCMDYEYWLRLGKLGVRIEYLEQKLAGSRLYPENKTFRSRKNVHKEINDMLKSRFGEVPDRWLLAYAHAAIASRTTANLRSPWFVGQVALASAVAALRWNGRIKPDLLRSGFSLLRSRM